MAPRPPIQAVIEEQAELDTSRRNWRLALFNEDGTPFAGEGGGGSLGEEVIDVSLASGWGNLGEYERLTAIKQGNLVTLTGVVQAGSAKGDGSVIGTLPEDWWPERICIRGGFGYFDVVAGYGHARFDVEPDGDIINRGSLGSTNWIAINTTYLIAPPMIT